MKLYTAKDITKAFPWISAGIINHRVKEGVLPITNPSTGTGIPNMFTMAEVVHCAVVDELATIGCLGKLAHVMAGMSHPTSVISVPVTLAMEVTDVVHCLENPFEVDLSIYEEHDFRVAVTVQILHEHCLTHLGMFPLALSNEPLPPGRYYWITYHPQTFSSRENIEKEIAGWLIACCPVGGRTAVRDGATMAVVGVRSLYERAAATLEG